MLSMQGGGAGADAHGGGESQTAALLEKLPEDWVVFHQVSVPGKRWTVDHLLIGPCGVIGLWSYDYPGLVTVAGDTLWGGGDPQTRELMSVREHGDAIARAIGVELTEAMCIHTAELSEMQFTVRGIEVVAPHRLTPWLLERPTQLLGIQVTATAAAARHHLEIHGLPGRPADTASHEASESKTA